MPIKIPKNLPAFDILQTEGLGNSSQLAETQDPSSSDNTTNLMPEKLKRSQLHGSSDPPFKSLHFSFITFQKTPKSTLRIFIRHLMCARSKI